MKPSKTNACQFCERELFLTFHHLVPKKMHGRRVVKELFSKEECNSLGLWLCRDCHKKIHKVFGHKELATQFNTKEKLMAHPEISAFVGWVSKQKKRVK